LNRSDRLLNARVLCELLVGASRNVLKIDAILTLWGQDSEQLGKATRATGR
jgi:hypothetical protein